jgi:hypothetical protein
MCPNEPLTPNSYQRGLEKIQKVSWKFAKIRMGVETTPLVIRGLSIVCLNAFVDGPAEP